MELKDNPLLQPEDFLLQYRQSAERLKNNPDLVSFDRLCYQLFVMNPDGKKFMETVNQRYLIPSLVNKESPNYQLMVIWADGFKDFPRLILDCIRAHDQRIKAEGRN